MSRRAAIGLLAGVSAWALYMTWMMTAATVSERDFFGSLIGATLLGVGAWFVLRNRLTEIPARLAAAIGTTAAALTLRLFAAVIGSI